MGVLNRLRLGRDRLKADYRSARDLGLGAPLEFRRARKTAEYQRAFDMEQPLVSAIVTTYNRAALLRERSVASLLRQTYPALEIIVVGDCCTDDTQKVMDAIDDPRLRFLNLPERGKYPEEPELRWMVAGTAPYNKALTMAKGQFITHLDDDDEHAPDRLEKLVAFAQQTRADLIFHPFRSEQPNHEWRVNRALDFALNSVTTSAMLYHRWFLRIPTDGEAYRYREPGDWNRLRKLRYLGARIRRYPEPLLDHFRERSQSAPPPLAPAAEPIGA